MRWTRRLSSAAARREKVASMMRLGSTPASTRWARRWASVAVLPTPAPAMTSSGASPCSTASRCASFSASAGSERIAARAMARGEHGSAFVRNRFVPLSRSGEGSGRGPATQPHWQIPGLEVSQRVGRRFVSRTASGPAEARRRGRGGDARASILPAILIFGKSLGDWPRLTYANSVRISIVYISSLAAVRESQ